MEHVSVCLKLVTVHLHGYRIGRSRRRLKRKPVSIFYLGKGGQELSREVGRAVLVLCVGSKDASHARKSQAGRLSLVCEECQYILPEAMVWVEGQRPGTRHGGLVGVIPK